MRPGWKLALLLLVTGTLCQCKTSKKPKVKLLKKLSHVVGRSHKASQPKTENGQKKNVMQPSQQQVAAMQNPESIQPSETEILNNLQNYNKHYINNEMAAETALLADQGIDDDSALKISNMAALPNGAGYHGAAGANAAIKTKISNSAHAQQDQSAEHSQAHNSPGGFDPNAYLYDANSWPEYSIHDSDYNNFHAVEMNNMNGENTDMPPMYNKPNGGPGTGYQNMEGEGGMEYPGGQGFPQGKTDGAAFNDEVNEEKGETIQKKPSQESLADKPKSPAKSGDGKPADDSGANSASNSQSSTKPAVQQSPQKAENNAAAANDAATQKQQQGQPQQQQQQQQQAKGAPTKLAASVARAAASLPPKAIASLVSSLVGGGKATTNQAQGQIQKNIVGAISQSLIPQDIIPAAEITQAATKQHKVAKPKKH